MAISRANHRALAEALRSRVLDGPGISDRATRNAAAERAAGGQTTATSYDDILRQIGEASDLVTSAQVDRLVREMGSEKAAFEVIAAAALGAGVLRWRCAMKVLDEARDAPEGN